MLYLKIDFATQSNFKIVNISLKLSEINSIIPKCLIIYNIEDMKDVLYK